jgi:hypothetical protein
VVEKPSEGTPLPLHYTLPPYSALVALKA